MSPDLNSLPPSRPTMHAPSRPSPVPANSPHSPQGSPSSRASMHSLASAAALNVADLSRRSSTSNTAGTPASRRSDERRRSLIALNINQNDPTAPAPGELISGEHQPSFTHQYSSNSPSSIGGTRAIASGDPHHQRTPSLGELHQELEEEQEAQVNRMLLMIRRQQSELERLRSQPDASTAASRQSSQAASATTAILDDLTPASELSSFHLPTTAARSQNIPRPPHRVSNSAPRSPALHALDPSQSPSSSPSAHLQPHHHSLLDNATTQRNSNSLRDESTYYQAETASLTRENQLLRQRIRELERQLTEGTSNVGTITGSVGHQAPHHFSNPAVHSPLIRAVDKD